MNSQIKFVGGKSITLKNVTIRVGSHFEGHKETKQMVTLKNFVYDPIQNGGQKRVCILTHNNGCQAMVFEP